MIESQIVRGINWDCQVPDALGFRRIATRNKRYGDPVVSHGGERCEDYGQRRDCSSLSVI